MSAQLSIIVPVFNRASTLKRALDSVRNQSVRPLELIIVDNNSSDESLAIARAWAVRHASPDFAITILEESTPGPAAARNRGLSAASAPWVYFLDSDDAMRQNAASAIINTARIHPDAMLLFGDIIEHNGKKKRRISPRRINRIMPIFNNGALCTLTMAIRRDFLNAAGGWNDKLRIWEDWELGLRLLLHSPETARIPALLADVYVSSGSVTGDTYFSRADRYEPTLRALEESLETSSHCEAPRLKRMVNFRRILLAALYAREGHTEAANHLRATTLAALTNDPWLKLLLKIAYRYIAAGGRAAGRLLAPLL